MKFLVLSICIVLGAFIILLQKYLYKTIRTPLTFFAILWCVVLSVANMQLYNYYSPSLLVNSIIIIGIVIFAICFCVFSGKKNLKRVIDNNFFECHLNLQIIYFVNIIATIFTIPFLGNAINIIRNNGLAFLRANAGDTNIGIASAGWQNVILDSVVRPVFMTMAILAVTVSFSEIRKKTKIVLLSIAVVENFLLTLLTAARAPMVNFVFYFIIAFIIFKGKNIIAAIKTEKKKIVVCIILIAIILYITNERNFSGDTSILENFYVYYFSGPSYMSRLLENVHEYGLNGKLLYGTATFGFITNWLSFIYTFLTGKSQGSLWVLGSVITNQQYWVGENTLLNAMCTVFYIFIVDWGILGIIIGPLIIAFISAKIFKNLYKRQTTFTYAIYIYWTYILIRTVFKWDLLNVDFAVFIVLMYLFTVKKIRIRI